MNVDKEKNIAWDFILKTKSNDELYELSVAVHQILRHGEFWRHEVRRRQDIIYKLRAENKKLRKALSSNG